MDPQIFHMEVVRMRPTKFLWKTAARLFIFTVLALPCLLTTPVLATTQVEVRFSAYYPEHYPVFNSGWKPWEEMVTKESKGTITFKNYLNGVLHAASHGFRATMGGVTDITHAYPGYQPASFALSHVNDLPFIFPKTYVGPLVMEELYPKYFKAEYEKMGVYLAAWVNVSGYNLISKTPVRKLEDLKGMKIRSTGGYCSEFLMALGAVPVMMQSAETYTGLQSGVVDAVLYADGSTAAYKLYEVAKYSTKLEIMNMGVPYAMNKKFFDKLAPAQKKFFYNKLRQASQMASYAYDIDDQVALKTMLANGVERIEPSAAEMQRMHDAVKPVWQKFINENEAKGLPAKQLMEDLQALVIKYKNYTPQEAQRQVTENPIQHIINF